MTRQATITSKGQITIPVAVREQLGLKPGDKVSFDDLAPDAMVLRRATRSLDSLIGCLSAYALPHPVGPEDIDAARRDEFGGGAGA